MHAHVGRRRPWLAAAAGVGDPALRDTGVGRVEGSLGFEAVVQLVAGCIVHLPALVGTLLGRRQAELELEELDGIVGA